ncbi:MAG: ATP-binding protein [Nostocales cyanobacterium]|nr:MAG: ATP-binding protein [Nostocales cyanobacterium]
MILRLNQGCSYEDISQQLNTTPAAALKQMGFIYERLGIAGKRGKEKLLRSFLAEKLHQSQQSSVATTTAEKIPEFPGTKISPPRHNLPALSTTKFINRHQEVNKLLELLSYQHSAHIISVEGIAGVGKTTLVLEVANRCLNSQHTIPQSLKFDAIIFTSAKAEYLTPHGLLPRLRQEQTLKDICREIAKVIQSTIITQASDLEQLEFTRDALAQIHSLLIVDNLETVTEKNQILAFLYDLPPTVKVIITTREQALFVPVRLSSLPETEALALINHQATEKGISLSKTQQIKLYQRTSGIPVAIVYAVGQIAGGYPVETIFQKLEQTDSDISRFCFQNSLELLREHPAYRLLLSLSLFVNSVTREAISTVGNLHDQKQIADGFAKLLQLSLINQEAERYSLLTLTRQFVLGELSQQQTLESELRENWFRYLRKLSENYGTDRQEWQKPDIKLEQEWPNILAVLRWGMEQNRFEDVWYIFRHIKNYAYVHNQWDVIIEITAWLLDKLNTANTKDEIKFVEVVLARVRPLSLRTKKTELAFLENLVKQGLEVAKTVNREQYLELIIEQIYLGIQQCNFADTLNLIQQQKQELNAPTKFMIQLLYYEAQIYYKTHQLSESESLYREVITKAEQINWQRGIIYTKHWLADVLLAMKRLQEAEDLLAEGLPQAQAYQDLRCIASYQTSYAKLEQIRGNLTKMKEWAKLAIAGFEQLKMEEEIAEIQTMLMG